MTKAKLYILVTMLVMLAFPSCAIIEINGLGNDYNDLTESQKALVRPLERFEDAQPGLVYKLTMPMLKEELEKQPKAIVRVFNPACRGNACKPLYLRYFTNELVGLPRKTKERDVPEELVGQFYFFEEGRLMKVTDEL